MFNVVALGECLIDFTPMKAGPSGHPTYEMNPGGAPANCLAAVQAFGGKTAFIGKVGADTFGEFLAGKLNAAGINTDGLVRDKDIHTTLAFVHLDDKGERSFDFFRKPGADIMLREDEVDVSLIDNAAVFHFGSLSLTDEPSRSACLMAAKYARKNGKLVSYDPNFRPPLWNSREEAVERMKEGLALADVVKMSEEELELITGCGVDRLEEGAQKLLEYGCKTVFITLGSEGAYYLSGKERGRVPGYSAQVADTTGCGDVFTGTVLFLMTQRPELGLEEMVRVACAAGKLCAQLRGGLHPELDAQQAYEIAGV